MIEPDKRMQEEQLVLEKYDEEGNRWQKLYFGGGAHLQNWLTQCIEIYGEHNIQVENVDSQGFRCFEESGEKVYRIWARVEGR